MLPSYISHFRCASSPTMTVSSSTAVASIQSCALKYHGACTRRGERYARRRCDMSGCRATVQILCRLSIGEPRYSKRAV